MGIIDSSFNWRLPLRNLNKQKWYNHKESFKNNEKKDVYLSQSDIHGVAPSNSTF